MSSINSISIKTAARKLPIKRKSPDPPNPNFTPKAEPQLYDSNDDEEEDDQTLNLDYQKPPPFKFHRIWTESDEIRFLQRLLHSSSQGMIFPRDLHLFYQRFSTSMSQPYTKSQLSEKLRRLRKKFRVISTRISHGLDPSLLSQHDRSLFQISQQLWDPNYSSKSPFNAKIIKKNTFSSPSSVQLSTHDVNVSFDPSFAPPVASAIPDSTDDHPCEGDDCEVKVENLDVGHVQNVNLSDGIQGIVVKTVIDVFEKSLNEVRVALVERGLHCEEQKCSTTSNSNGDSQAKMDDLMKRCREQRLAELDVLAKHLRLVLENSIHDH